MTTTAYTTRGSPPHTRDKSSSGIAYGLFIRIIPAYAGQIIFGHFMPTPHQDHPRIRGTNWYAFKSALLSAGSSPHTRDKLLSGLQSIFSAGIIPAYAGQIGSIFSCTSLIKDHPRIRGTNCLLPSLIRIHIGSSPHTRDKLIMGTAITTGIGITPAYAGQMKDMRHDKPLCRDHPRIRGTNYPVLYTL